MPKYRVRVQTRRFWSDRLYHNKIKAKDQAKRLAHLSGRTDALSFTPTQRRVLMLKTVLNVLAERLALQQASNYRSRMQGLTKVRMK